MEKWERDCVKERVASEFWIDTEGKIKKWEGTLKEADDWASLHTLIATKILSRNKEVQAGRIDGCDILHKKGWIAMGSACYGNRIDREPTQAQINTLDELGFRRIQEMDGTVHSW